ncbi:penicillin-binding protein 2 [Methylacidimicrobium tartarophylax]|uniref:Beta-lactamase n=1 Tax=Methylacidimicrobium tartarophylax TaxID=1041768 RepID=A0A5E6M5E4_9BACT|nr:penicillin-binding protein 2 [Methylacidimicrobium tartarophylax]VVM04559.1 penicillin-binding protein 2 [Methylacidimicrobium tartarophylax]
MRNPLDSPPPYLPKLRVGVVAVVISACLGLLIARLWVLQVIEGQTYANRLRNQTTIALRLDGARGPILDRNGIALAENRATYEIDLYLDQLVRDYPKRHRGRVPRIQVERRMGGATLLRKEPDIYRVVMTDLIPIANALHLEVKLDPKELQRHYFTSPNVPFRFASELSYVTVARFAEQNLGVPGIDVAVRPVRHYNFGAFASHILGYVGPPGEKERLGPDGYDLETMGRIGVERLMDGQLQGKPGGRILRVNYRGYIVAEEGYTNPNLGASVYLTLDARIQAIVQEALRTVGRGAAIVMDPNTGDILSMASVPDFDPNGFVPKISQEDWKKLTSDPTRPLLNRSVSAYSPGSTFKVLISLAALKYGAITLQTQIFSPAAIDIGGHLFHDWTKTGRGNITLDEALQYSCNTFFYQLGIRTGIKHLDEMAELCGFGQPTGLSYLGESPGILPGPAWMKAQHPLERWTTAHTANLSIGQGFLEVTPLQMVLLMGAVANGGTLLYPRLIVGVSDSQGRQLASIPPRPRADLGLRPQDLNAIRKGLLAVVESGTGHSVAIPGIAIAGKTGSAQAKRRWHGKLYNDTRAWFIGFAPYEHPKYVVCVMVEGGIGGGATAGPIVHKIMEGILALERDGSAPQLVYFNPAQGNFNGLTEIQPKVDTPAPVRPSVPVHEEEDSRDNSSADEG